jgi:2-amino-4-hydroxy-6-hydroxymethyldihydropteridine diphosphokinase
MPASMAEPLAVAALSLGGNVGDVVGALRYACDRLAAAGVVIRARSSVYRTRAWGRTDQPDFLNMAMLVETTFFARDLLKLCLAIEAERGRVRDQRWGPRTLDIDLITYGDQTIDAPGLTIPHPRVQERAFVLVPLAEIAPDLRIGDETVATLVRRVDVEGVALDNEATRRLAL